MDRVRQLRLCGTGGQGLVLGGVILGHAAIYDGKYVAGSDSYGVRVRGGYALSDVVISNAPIVYPHVMEADILIPMGQEAYDEHIGGVALDAVVIYDDQLVQVRPREGIRQVGIPATSTAIRELDQPQAANIVILGAMVAITELVSRDSLKKAVEENVGERFREMNLKAVELGFALGEEKWRL
ncbi:MAG: 2-oxoacid:acceptor oxidoreductase family protein [Deltaproteobacteria bacterium]|nr:2-oxoacid:acceptor oxidoreductase family protein [Deltaproteobacteria bacterium]